MRIVAELPELRRQYEQIVASKPNHSFFSLIWVQDILHPYWKYVLDEQGTLLIRIPVAKKFGVKAYLQPLFIRSIPMLFDEQSFQTEKLVAFLKKQKLLHINLNGYLNKDLKIKYGKFQTLSNIEGPHTFRKGYTENIKRSLKKANQLFAKEIDYTDFHTFFTKQKGENIGSLNAAAWSRLEILADSAKSKNALYCCGAFLEGQLLAVALFFNWNKTLYFMKGTLNDEGKKVGALIFLIDGVLEKFEDTCNTIDFIGSNQESIAAFYRKFGAKDRFYSIIKGRIRVV